MLINIDNITSKNDGETADFGLKFVFENSLFLREDTCYLAIDI